MDQEAITQEIRNLLQRMGFGEEIVSINAHLGTASRFCISLSHREMFSREDDGRHNSLANILIGERGATLASLEHILKKIIKKRYGEEQKFTLDINDYRIQKMEDLKQDVKNAAKAVRMYKKDVPLRPMSAFERRIVHLLLAEYPDIATESIGLEPERRVVIKPYAYQ